MKYLLSILCCLYIYSPTPQKAYCALVETLKSIILTSTMTKSRVLLDEVVSQVGLFAIVSKMVVETDQFHMQSP